MVELLILIPLGIAVAYAVGLALYKRKLDVLNTRRTHN